MTGRGGGVNTVSPAGAGWGLVAVSMLSERQAVHRYDERKQQILDAAETVFAENGYDAASIAEIATRAGMSQAGMLHHFPSKAVLLIAVLDRRDDIDAAQVHVLDNPGGIAILRGMAALIQANALHRNETRLKLVMAVEASNPAHPAHEWARQRYLWGCRMLAAGFRQDIEAGRVRSDLDVDATASAVFAVMDGLKLQWLLDPERVDVGAVFGNVIEEMIAAIVI